MLTGQYARYAQKRQLRDGGSSKWHLGLGPKGGPDWNGDIKPGPLEIGFMYSFLLPATAEPATMARWWTMATRMTLWRN